LFYDEKKWRYQFISMFSSFFFSPCEHNHAKSVSFTDVKAAIDSVKSGDIVVVPSGTAAWSSQLLITKEIVLRGKGIDKQLLSMHFLPPILA